MFDHVTRFLFHALPPLLSSPFMETPFREHLHYVPKDAEIKCIRADLAPHEEARARAPRFTHPGSANLLSSGTDSRLTSSHTEPSSRILAIHQLQDILEEIPLLLGRICSAWSPSRFAEAVDITVSPFSSAFMEMTRRGSFNC